MSLVSEGGESRAESRLEQLMTDFASANNLPMLNQSPISSESPVYASAIAVVTSENSVSHLTRHHVGYVYGVHKRDGIFIARQAVLSSDGRPYLNNSVHNGSYIKPRDLNIGSGVAYEQVISLQSEDGFLTLDDALKLKNFDRIKKDEVEKKLVNLPKHPHATDCPNYSASEIAIVNKVDEEIQTSHVGFVFGIHERSIHMARDAILNRNTNFTTHQRGGFLRLAFVTGYTVLRDLR